MMHWAKWLARDSEAVKGMYMYHHEEVKCSQESESPTTKMIVLVEVSKKDHRPS
jgi:hypothetical protein